MALADVEEEALTQAAAELGKAGYDVLPVLTDVSDAASVEALAAEVGRVFGAVYVLCNNAGVTAGGASAIWDVPDKDWEWVLGVNFWSVLHGLRAFVPRMPAHGEAGHIVNTASISGVIAGGGPSGYGASKHAVLSLSETLLFDLQEQQASIGVSVLCPGPVQTRILTAQRNRAESERTLPPPDAELIRSWLADAIEEGLSPGAVAEIVLDAIERGQFYILPNAGSARLVTERTRRMVSCPTM